MLLAGLRRLLRFARRPLSQSRLAYWENRARTYGRRAVLNLGHGEDEVEAVTRYQLETIFPHLARSLRGDEGVALDFGCGPGRFTPHLSRLIGGRAIGVDPVRSFIELAPAGPQIEYKVSDGRCIPLADAAVDLVWVCLVLGGIPDSQLAETAGEIERVLRPDGLLFIVENTAMNERCEHWAFRSVAEYQKLLAFVSLIHLHDYEDLGQPISILAGRKASRPKASNESQMTRVSND
jgi:SAM-dependent methyltransferase